MINWSFLKGSLLTGILLFPPVLFANTTQQQQHLNVEHPLNTAFSHDNRTDLNPSSNKDKDFSQLSSEQNLQSHNGDVPDAKLLHFDAANLQWETHSQSIKGMYIVNSIQTAGKYSIAYGCVANGDTCRDIDSRVIAYNDGNTWTPSQTIPNLMTLDSRYLYYAYSRTGEEPNAWVIGHMTSNYNDHGVSFFDGKTFSPAVTLPQFKNNRFAFIVSNHNAFVIDYTNNSIVSTSGTQWNPIASPTTSTIISVFAKNGDGDLYVLAYDQQKQSYFIVSLLPDKTWSKPIVLTGVPNDQITSLMVVSVEGDTTGKINILLLGKDPHDGQFHILESTDNGQSWFDNGVMPDGHSGNNNAGFTSNNGCTNYGNIQWEYSGYYTNQLYLYYLNPTAKTPIGWTKIAIPANWTTGPIYMDPLFSSNGKQGWAEPATVGFFRLFFYDLDFQQLIGKTNVTASSFEPGDHGQGFGIGFEDYDPNGNSILESYYNDGESDSWTINTLPSDMQLESSRLFSLSSDSKGIFVGSSNNVWIYQSKYIG